MATRPGSSMCCLREQPLDHHGVRTRILGSVFFYCQRLANTAKVEALPRRCKDHGRTGLNTGVLHWTGNLKRPDIFATWGCRMQTGRAHVDGFPAKQESKEAPTILHSSCGHARFPGRRFPASQTDFVGSCLRPSTLKDRSFVARLCGCTPAPAQAPSLIGHRNAQ